MIGGICQASILGRLLFICNVNDLPSCLPNGNDFLYADFTALIVKSKPVTDIDTKLKNDL